MVSWWDAKALQVIWFCFMDGRSPEDALKKLNSFRNYVDEVNKLEKIEKEKKNAKTN